jgi:HD-GYP domain-containing protein (c-di-GMP phosphodiesterase class II)
VIAALHDIGKIAVPESIINKPGKLDMQEFEIMKTHTKHGAAILTSVQGELGDMARQVALYHHENWDGSGYWGKKACNLPVFIHIITICDVAVALLSKRVYKEPWSPAQVIEYIQSRSGTQFNQFLVDIFIGLVLSDENVKPFIYG